MRMRTLLVLLLMRISRAAGSAEPEEAPSETGAGHHLHSVVSAWLQKKEKVSGGDASAPLQAYPLLDAGEGNALKQLTPADKAEYHPHTGCIVRAACCCYPSIRVLKRVVELAAPDVIVEYGSFLGEATLGLVDVISTSQKKPTTLVALDTWKEPTGYTGLWTEAVTYKPPSHVSLAAITTHSPSYLQFVANVARAPKDLVVAVPLLDTDAAARAAAIGHMYPQPRLIYVNPPTTISLRHDILPHLWRLLACEGLMVGHGYHKVQEGVDEFAAHVGVSVEAHVVHAPGSAKWEKDLAFSHEMLAGNLKSNVSYWMIRGKACTAPTSR